jgi:hypothetical protein
MWKAAPSERSSRFRDGDIPVQVKWRIGMKDLTRRSFASKAFAGLAAFGISSGLNQPAEAQLVWSTSKWNLTSFEELLHEKARIKQLFDITQVENGAALAKVKNSLNGLHYGFGVSVDQINVICDMHGPANLLNYDDYVWAKYRIGAWLEINDPRTHQPAVRNPYHFSKLTEDAPHITAPPKPRRRGLSASRREHAGAATSRCSLFELPYCFRGAGTADEIADQNPVFCPALSCGEIQVGVQE